MTFTDENRRELLALLEEGKSQKTIAETLGIAPSVVNYHVKKLLEEDLIREIKTTRYYGPHQKLYSLTNSGKSAIGSQIQLFSPGGEEKQQKLESRPRWLLHHAQYKYPILKDAPIQMSVAVHMRNWTKKIDEWKWCKAVKSGKSIILHIKNLYGDNPHELELRAQKIADKMASIYEDNWGMGLGRPVMLGTPHWKDLWDDETWAEYSKYISIETPTGFIDKTPPEGGLEFKSAESASNHVNVGDNVVKTLAKVVNLEARVQEQTEVLTQIRDALDAFLKTQTYEKLPEKDEKRDVT